MKYGIRLTKSDGSVLYCHSTKTYRGQFDSDATGMALFAQEPTAVKAVASLRKEGVERLLDGILDVVCIELTVVDSISVAHPPKKDGFILTATQNVIWNNSTRVVYYNGPKKIQSEWNTSQWVEPIEQATVFPTEAEAEARLEVMIVEQQHKVLEATHYLKLAEDEHAASNMLSINSRSRSVYDDRLERAKLQSHYTASTYEWLSSTRIIPTL